jgi:hypothetical protein
VHQIVEHEVRDGEAVTSRGRRSRMRGNSTPFAGRFWWSPRIFEPSAPADSWPTEV